MNSFPDDAESSPEQPLSDLRINLEEKFVSIQDGNKGESMNVYARIRPMLVSEIEAGYKECIGLVDENLVRAVAPASSSKFKMSSHLCQDIIEDFTFTAGYGPETGQFVLFHKCMMDTIKNFIEGLNSLVFTYGTTGSGKTYTLQGNADNPGIIPLSLHLFFSSVEDQLLDKVFFKPDKFSGVIALNENDIKKELDIKEQLLSTCSQEEKNLKNSSDEKSLGMLLCESFSNHFESEGRQTTLGPEEMAQAQAAALMKEISKKSADNQSGYCSVWISFIEIYNENIYDLLQPNFSQRAKLNLGEDKNGDVYVKGVREVCVSNAYEALSLLNFGQKNLRIASTKLNYQSSRSHCIFTVKVVRIPDPENMSYAKVNRLSFCDLAGSERAAKSQTTGMRLKEAGCINTSLLVLGRCLEQLRLNPSQRDKKLIPFRESKLTRLFSGFFTGRGKSVMITNASPSELTFDETLHVLRFSAIAKELIINDSYIKTAANTLQSIANMWTDVKTTCKNLSLASDKSISFDDSMEDALQEKDELIEKLLDLAESLKSNLEHEKKEKAELEIKIRQDVCVEYSEFRDELLAMQKQAFEEERDALRAIYEKRISAMEQRYEKIILDFKTQLEESFTSDDETSSKETFRTPSSVNAMKQFEMCANASEDEALVNAGASPKSKVANVEKDSRKTEEELQKTIDYSLSLEVELEHLRKKFEDVQLMLENTMKDNDSVKKELDAYKIDVLTFRTSNDTLLKDKLDLEADLKAFREDLVTVTQEKEALFEELTDSRENLSCLNNQVSDLLKSINELTRVNEETATKYEKSLEEVHMRNSQLEEQLLAVSQELQAEKKETKNLKSVISTMEERVSELQSTEQDNLCLKSAVESLSSVNDELRDANISLKAKLEVAEASIAATHQIESGTKDDIESLKKVHKEEIRKLDDSLKKHEAEANEAKEVLKSVNKVLESSQDVIEKQKKEINSKEEEFMLLKEQLSQLQSIKEDMEAKVKSLTESLELDKQKRSELADELDKVKEQAAKFDSLQTNYMACKNEIATLEKANLDLEEKLMLSSRKSECELSFKDQLESKCRKLEEALNTISSQKDEMEKLRSENRKCYDELAELQNVKKNLENKFDEISFQIESEMKFKEQLECESKRLEEAVNTINLQKDEIENLRCENRKCNDDLAEIKKLKNDLQNKLDEVIISQNENVHELVQVLEKCEIKAAHNIKEMQSNLEQLEEKLASGSVNHEKECTVLHHLIDTLQKCEAFASNKLKQFHSTNIKYVEQIVDLENILKTKEKAIDVLNDDINDLHKKYKDLQTSSKKQQTEIQKIKSESEKMEVRLTDYKKLNESLKCDLAKLEAEKDKLENECKILKEKEETAKKTKEEHHLKNKEGHERRTSRKRKEDTISDDEKTSETIVLKEVKNQADKRRNTKSTELSEKSTENKKQNTENQNVKRKNKKGFEQSKADSENRKQKTEIPEIREDKRRNKKAIEKKENVTENKKQKTEIYEEADENCSSENDARQEKKAGRRQLKCMSNVASERESVQLKDEDSSSKSKMSKRKIDASESKSPEKRNLKKLKMHSVQDAENANKPQNLRVLLLKRSVNINDISLPSPRMTRGRKRLVLAKELTSSPRTVRS